MDDEKNETYNFGRVVLQNDEGDKEGDVYEPNFLKLFWRPTNLQKLLLRMIKSMSLEKQFQVIGFTFETR